MDFLLPTIFFLSFLTALSGAVMPGPLFSVAVTETLHRGIRTGPLMIIGHTMLELGLVICLLVGLAPVLTRPEIFITISLIGSVILLWFGITMFRDLPKLTLVVEAENYRNKNLVLTGALLSLFNPFWLLWWSTIGLGYLLQALHYGLAGVTVFFIGHALADLGWYAFISYGICRGRHVLKNSHYKVVVGCCAAFLLATSGWFFYNGIHKYLYISK
ncbi:LysE family translocator [Desulfosediminicola ganghwensis]|uniref:LysE family translocator n=1 Tax=Desulfosediminicola ganghwensis TaxID=2569540 RepID=UPI0010AC19BB|nr:LysE family transporter [Desulfosediminicola ganghwensis]